jgi:hypothetical protein
MKVEIYFYIRKIKNFLIGENWIILTSFSLLRQFGLVIVNILQKVPPLKSSLTLSFHIRGSVTLRN